MSCLLRGHVWEEKLASRKETRTGLSERNRCSWGGQTTLRRTRKSQTCSWMSMSRNQGWPWDASDVQVLEARKKQREDMTPKQEKGWRRERWAEAEAFAWPVAWSLGSTPRTGNKMITQSKEKRKRWLPCPRWQGCEAVLALWGGVSAVPLLS